MSNCSFSCLPCTFSVLILPIDVVDVGTDLLPDGVWVGTDLRLFAVVLLPDGDGVGTNVHTFTVVLLPDGVGVATEPLLRFCGSYTSRRS